MKAKTVLQSFAVNKQGKLVSVRDVDNGKACGCCCPSCEEELVARQGEVRAWHFAHASGSHCEGAAEGALHLAAKQIIADQQRILVPRIDVTVHHTLRDGRNGQGASHRPSTQWNLESVRLEVPIGAVRADILATTRETPLIIEIAVTHPADELKKARLREIGIPSIEIILVQELLQEWTWQALGRAVLEDPLNRHWLYQPDTGMLLQEAQPDAIAAAKAKALANQSVAKRTKLSLFGVPIHLIEYRWGSCVWYPYSDRTYSAIKPLAHQYGGWWDARYRNWRFPSAACEPVEAALRALGARECR